MKLLSLFMATSALALLAPRSADACGGVFRRTTTKTVPSLQVEQVLAIYDPAKEQEHFIRQLAFRDAKEPFGFIVPTPSLPTVAKVDGSPFAALARQFSPEVAACLVQTFRDATFAAPTGGAGATLTIPLTLTSS
jgi:hypothetical protein